MVAGSNNCASIGLGTTVMRSRAMSKRSIMGAAVNEECTITWSPRASDV